MEFRKRFGTASMPTGKLSPTMRWKNTGKGLSLTAPRARMLTTALLGQYHAPYISTFGTSSRSSQNPRSYHPKPEPPGRLRRRPLRPREALGPYPIRVLLPIQSAVQDLQRIRPESSHALVVLRRPMGKPATAGLESKSEGLLRGAEVYDWTYWARRQAA